MEELIVRVGKKNYPHGLKMETKTIQNAITKPWAIRLKGKVFISLSEFTDMNGSLP